jgi:hypothetical protein
VCDPIPGWRCLPLKALHDGPDAYAVAILANIRAGAALGARVRLIEGVLDEAAPSPRAAVDIEMRVMADDRSRAPRADGKDC